MLDEALTAERTAPAVSHTTGCWPTSVPPSFVADRRRERRSRAAVAGRRAELSRSTHARAAGGRDDPPPAGAAGRGPAARARRDPRPALVAPAGPAELADALAGRRVELSGAGASTCCGASTATCYLAQHLRMTGAVLCDPKPEPAHTRVRIARPLGRGRARPAPVTSAVARGPAPLRHRRAAARRRRWRRSSRRASGSSRCTNDFTRRAPARARAGPERADQGVPARPAPDRRGREHLRGRGAVPGAASIRCARPGSSRALSTCGCVRALIEALQAGIDARGARRSTTSATSTA